jgi:simple sugar transport system ATP-binding protein
MSVSGVDKWFGALHAVRSVSFEAAPGRVLAICGENGAGKSTLLKVASGVLRPDGGRVSIGGAVLDPHTAREAIRRGVGMVQQHFALVGTLTALENVMLGVEPTRGFGVLDVAHARKKMAAVLEELGAELPLDVPVEQLGVGDRQRLEIARTLYRDAMVVILDEPTAVLSPAEAKTLYATLRRLAGAQRAIVVVTHKLDEVRDHADDVLVLRRGEVVLTRPLGDEREGAVEAIARAMMGRDPPGASQRGSRTPGEVVLELANLTCGRALRGLSMKVRAGEVVGVAGVEGNGQRELAAVLGGLCERDSGEVWGGRVVVVHEERQREGLVLDASVRDNLVLGELARFDKGPWLDLAALEAEARRRFDRAHIQGTLDGAARSLSGGNQQKVVIARALARPADVFFLSHPTRGVDFGAAHAIHADIREAADRGKGVVVVSADLNELRRLADRILVLAKGVVAGEFPPSARDDEIGRAMLSVGGRDAA